jgi:hypothetical protein
VVWPGDVSRTALRQEVATDRRAVATELREASWVRATRSNARTGSAGWTAARQDAGARVCLAGAGRVQGVSRMRRTPTQEVLAGPQRSMDSVASAVRTARPMENGDVERSAMDQLRPDRWDPIA